MAVTGAFPVWQRGGCAPKGIGISGEAKAVNGDKSFKKFSCNCAITNGISRWGGNDGTLCAHRRNPVARGKLAVGW